MTCCKLGVHLLSQVFSRGSLVTLSPIEHVGTDYHFEVNWTVRGRRSRVYITEGVAEGPDLKS